MFQKCKLEHKLVCIGIEGSELNKEIKIVKICKNK